MTGAKRAGVLLPAWALFLLLLFTLLFPALAEEKTKEEALISRMARNYIAARGYSGREDFAGLCGECVGFQLFALGIFPGGAAPDANLCFEHYSEREPREGYEKMIFPSPLNGGEYTLESICRTLDGMNPDGRLTCTVFCFQKGSWSDLGQTYGHVLLVYAVYNGKVYWKESNDKRNHVESIEEFCKRYSESYGRYVFDGAITFKQSEAN